MNIMCLKDGALANSSAESLPTNIESNVVEEDDVLNNSTEIKPSSIKPEAENLQNEETDEKLVIVVRDLGTGDNGLTTHMFIIPESTTVDNFLEEVAAKFKYKSLKSDSLSLSYQKLNGTVELTNQPKDALMSSIPLVKGIESRNSLILVNNHSELHNRKMDDDDLGLGASASPTSQRQGAERLWSDVNGVNAAENSTPSDEASSSYSSRSDGEINHVGLVNQAMTCYLNSLLQTLFMTPEFRNALYRWEFKGPDDEGKKSIPFQLQKLFLQLQTASRSAVETTNLTKSFGWDSSEAWQQHDIQELCRVMFDALEMTLKNTDQSNLINNLYEGKMKDYVRCLECDNEGAREDTFLDIPLPIRSFGSTVAFQSIEEALAAFVEPEVLCGNNQYQCSTCNKHCDAHKGLKFTHFPYLLTFHLKRFDFDYQTLHRIKLNDKVTFPMQLNLSPFLEPSNQSSLNLNSPSMDRKEKSSGKTAQNSNLSEKSELLIDKSETLIDKSETLIEKNEPLIDKSETLEKSETLIEKSEPLIEKSEPLSEKAGEKHDDASTTDSGSSALDEEDSTPEETTSANTPHLDEDEGIDCSSIHSSSTPVKDLGGVHSDDLIVYDLFSIMIHSGSASGGHYYAYIKDYSTSEWFCFNDQNVSRITQEDITKTYGGYGSCGGYYSSWASSANAYMLMYRKIDKSKNVVALNRENLPPHITKLLTKMTSEEASEKVAQEFEKSLCKIKVFCRVPNESQIQKKKIKVHKEKTLKETTALAHEEFELGEGVPVERCRLVAYDEVNENIVASFENQDSDLISDVLNTIQTVPSNPRSSYKYDIFLEIRDEGRQFEEYKVGGVSVKVYEINYKEGEVYGPHTIRTSQDATIREFKEHLRKVLHLGINPLRLTKRYYNDLKLLSNSERTMEEEGFYRTSDVFVEEEDGLCNDSTRIDKILERYENTITIPCEIPRVNKEVLDALKIPPLDTSPPAKMSKGTKKYKHKLISSGNTELHLNEEIRSKTRPNSESQNSAGSMNKLDEFPEVLHLDKNIVKLEDEGVITKKEESTEVELKKSQVTTKIERKSEGSSGETNAKAKLTGKEGVRKVNCRIEMQKSQSKSTLEKGKEVSNEQDKVTTEIESKHEKDNEQNVKNISKHLDLKECAVVDISQDLDMKGPEVKTDSHSHASNTEVKLTEENSKSVENNSKSANYKIKTETVQNKAESAEHKIEARSNKTETGVNSVVDNTKTSNKINAEIEYEEKEPSIIGMSTDNNKLKSNANKSISEPKDDKTELMSVNVKTSSTDDKIESKSLDLKSDCNSIKTKSCKFKAESQPQESSNSENESPKSINTSSDNASVGREIPIQMINEKKPLLKKKTREIKIVREDSKKESTPEKDETLKTPQKKAEGELKTKDKSASPKNELDSPAAVKKLKPVGRINKVNISSVFNQGPGPNTTGSPKFNFSKNKFGDKSSNGLKSTSEQGVVAKKSAEYVVPIEKSNVDSKDSKIDMPRSITEDSSTESKLEEEGKTLRNTSNSRKVRVIPIELSNESSSNSTLDTLGMRLENSQVSKSKVRSQSPRQFSFSYNIPQNITSTISLPKTITKPTDSHCIEVSAPSLKDITSCSSTDVTVAGIEVPKDTETQSKVEVIQIRDSKIAKKRSSVLVPETVAHQEILNKVPNTVIAVVPTKTDCDLTSKKSETSDVVEKCQLKELAKDAEALIEIEHLSKLSLPIASSTTSSKEASSDIKNSSCVPNSTPLALLESGPSVLSGSNDVLSLVSTSLKRPVSLMQPLTSVVFNPSTQLTPTQQMQLSDEEDGPSRSEGTLGVHSDQSASEDSSLTSDSDRTLVGDPPEEFLSSQAICPDYDVSSPEDNKEKNKCGQSELSVSSDDSDWVEDKEKEEKYYVRVQPNAKKANMIELSVDRRITIGQLKKELEKHVGVAEEHFKISVCKVNDNNQDYEFTRAKETLLNQTFDENTILKIDLSRALLPGEFKGKVYLLDLTNSENPAKFLIDLIICQGDLVEKVKSTIVSQVNFKHQMELDEKSVRLRRKNWKNPLTIALNHQRFLNDVMTYANWELYLQVLTGPEIKSGVPGELVLFIKRWHPSAYSTDPLLEVAFPQPTTESLRTKISEISGIDLENVEIAKGKGSFPCDMSLLDINTDLDWTQRDGDLDQRPLYIMDDGNLVYYRDKSEPLKTLSDSERSELATSENLRLNREVPYTPSSTFTSSSSNSRGKEKGLRIYLNPPSTQ